jgi:inhibitor of KinA
LSGVTIQPASDRSLFISFGDEISIEAHHQVAHLTHALEGQRGVLNLHPAFASVLIDFDPRLHTQADIEALARQRMETAVDEARPARVVEIPVCYGGEFGPDLEFVARHAGLTPERVIELHAAADYLVYFVGFATCFPYLGGLPSELATPRLSAPRKLVPAGSVAIGGSQAGIYPLASPGGWRIVGRTPLALFDPQSSPPPLLRMGDRVRFVPIARLTDESVCPTLPPKELQGLWGRRFRLPTDFPAIRVFRAGAVGTLPRYNQLHAAHCPGGGSLDGGCRFRAGCAVECSSCEPGNPARARQGGIGGGTRR